jgi:hypothetical protein
MRHLFGQRKLGPQVGQLFARLRVINKHTYTAQTKDKEIEAMRS